MKAAIAYHCTCGHTFVICLDEGEVDDDRRSWRAAVREAAAGLGGTFVDGGDERFSCARCGATYAAGARAAQRRASALTTRL
jgi:hypothetical protein